jgi:hypothetical protein
MQARGKTRRSPVRTRTWALTYPRKRRDRRRQLCAETLEKRELLTADVIITEFMADNGGVRLDEDGDASDWIELYNRGDASQNMDGWYLTDKASTPKKWRLPGIVIDPGESILVWASDKNRADPAGELHTNFGLSKNGEYLGLIRPDGVTIASQFAPSFPAQFTDVSYGIPTVEATYSLVSHSSPTQVLVPTGSGLGATWTTEAFVPDAAWRSGAQGVGFDTTPDYLPLIGTNVSEMNGVNSSVYVRIPFVAASADFDRLVLHMRYDDGFVAYINGQEVARRNSPASVLWNSSAAADRTDNIAIQYETIDLSAYAGLIEAGSNVLAIQGLNVVSTSSDLLIDASLEAGKVEVLTSEPPRYFFVPTPGGPNVAGTLDTRPIILDVANSDSAKATSVAVTARVVPSGSPLRSVDLYYRVMYGAEVLVSMFDDGLHGDGNPADGVFGGIIPAAVAGAGQMVRYAVTATAESLDTGRAPRFSNPATTARYYGYVVPDPTVTSALPIFQFFVQNPNWFRNADGTINRNVTSASFYYQGKLYDNIHISARGDTSIIEAYPNQKFKVDFNDEDKFIFSDGRGAIGAFNLDNVYQDPSAARLTLGAEVFREAGAYAQLIEPVHARMNGQFYSLGLFSERYNGAFLRRNGLGDEGALYESEGLRDSLGYLRPDAGNLATTLGMEKDNREYEASFADLQELISGISPSNPNRYGYIFDNVNIPEVVNVLAVYSLLKQYDRDAHNYYVYRDSDGNREWSLLPYDLDLIWDRLAEPLYGTNYFSGHPFQGSSQYPTWAGTHWNRLHDAFADSPVLSQMVLRRLRTLMDEILQPPGTPQNQRILEARVDALAAQIAPEVRMDQAKWGLRTGTAWGNSWSFAGGVAQLKAAFDLRRNYLYSLSIIPSAQTENPSITIGAFDVTPTSADQDEEYIQLVNPNSYAVDVSGWQLANAVSYTIADGVIIPARGSLYIAKDVNAFRARKTGPSGGQQLFVQGNYDGNLAASGETITLVRANGTTADSRTYAAITAPPVLGAFPDQSLTSGVLSPSIPITVTDDDTPTENLTFSGTTQSQLYLLDQQLNLTAPTVVSYSLPYYQNIRGMQEKYLLNPNGVNPINQWYYLLPNGDFYLFTGNPSSFGTPSTLQGILLANVGPAVYGNPALLHSAQPANVPVTFQFTTGASPTLHILPAAGYVGSFTATITASDGSHTASTQFHVQVNAPVTAAPVLSPIANQVLTSGVVSPPIPLVVRDDDTPTTDLAFAVTTQSSLYLLDQQLNLNAPSVANYSLAYYQNIRGAQEKYLLNPNGANPVNQWYYLLPDGNLYLFTGNPAAYGTPATLLGRLIANVGVAVYQNPALLHNAQPTNVPVTFQFTTGNSPTLHIAPGATYVGSFVATVTVSDGSKTDSKSFQVQVNEPTTAPPVLGRIADQVLRSGQTSVVPLSVSDADTPLASLSFTATAQSSLYVLDQQLNLTAPTVGTYPFAYYQNIRGMQEKYLRNPNGTNPVNLWYYILPNGNLYLFTGNPSVYGTPASLQGTLLTNVGAEVYQNPALLHSAQPTSIPVTFQFVAGEPPTLRITPAASYVGTFQVTVTVTDGVKSDSEVFGARASMAGEGEESSSYDVSGDGVISPLDALLVINYLNQPRLSGPSATAQNPPRLDTNGDGRVTPLDALLLINRLNRVPDDVDTEPVIPVLFESTTTATVEQAATGRSHAASVYAAAMLVADTAWATPVASVGDAANAASVKLAWDVAQAEGFYDDVDTGERLDDALLDELVADQQAWGASSDSRGSTSTALWFLL